VIVEVNGAKITTKNPLQQEIMKYAPGDKITVKYLRNGEEKETEITLGEAETDVKKEE
jgi:putative serine protease PepD